MRATSGSENRKRQSVLLIGLGRYADPAIVPMNGMTGADVEKLVAESMQRAHRNGFDCTSLYLDPHSPKSSLETLGDKLHSQQWDAVMVGWGLRTSKDLTGLFERVINLCVEISPKARFAFSTSPGTVDEALLRALPSVDQEYQV